MFDREEHFTALVNYMRIDIILAELILILNTKGDNIQENLNILPKTTLDIAVQEFNEIGDKIRQHTQKHYNFSYHFQMNKHTYITELKIYYTKSITLSNSTIDGRDLMRNCVQDMFDKIIPVVAETPQQIENPSEEIHKGVQYVNPKIKLEKFGWLGNTSSAISTIKPTQKTEPSSAEKLSAMGKRRGNP